jgi:hypothetical protein
MNEVEARRLWEQLRLHFVKIEQAIQQIVEQEAWAPLGYSDFAEAWSEMMSGYPLPTAEAKARVAYAILDSGRDAQAVVGATGGVIADRIATRLAEQHRIGVPAGSASTRVRAHFRSQPSPRVHLSLELRQGEIEDLESIARARGLDVKSEALRAIRSHFRALERAARNGAA